MIDRAHDLVSERLIAEFVATLRPWLYAIPPDEAPLGLHWCLAPPHADTEKLGPDGHPPRLHAVSELDYPRRMWIGGSLDIVSPFRPGQQVTRSTTLAQNELKFGRTGSWCLTGADHRFDVGGDILLSEHQDIAFRPASASTPSQLNAVGAPRLGDLTWTVATPPTLLFRYSALTFNGHRIHYDEPYATNVEGYPGLVVHGPLQATLLLNMAAVLLGRPPRKFAYRAISTLSACHTMIARGRCENVGAKISMFSPAGIETMSATAE